MRGWLLVKQDMECEVSRQAVIVVRMSASAQAVGQQIALLPQF
jgi:hypothetical protein